MRVIDIPDLELNVGSAISLTVSVAVIEASVRLRIGDWELPYTAPTETLEIDADGELDNFSVAALPT